MRIAYTTTFDAQDIHNWSGTPFHMAKAFAKNDVEVNYIGKLQRKLPRFFKLKQAYKKFITQQRESPRFNEVTARHYSSQVLQQLNHTNADVIVSPLINPIAYLDCQQPIVLWTDAVYASLVGFYPAFAYHSAKTIQQGNAITYACLSRVKLALFSSHWAARAAIEFYGIDGNKVGVVPFGANIESYPSATEISALIDQRMQQKKIRLLFLAKSWERKGGDIALNVAKALYDAGMPIELSIVGYTPDIQNIPSYVKCYGYISKQTVEGKNLITELLSQSHFLILPSRADACPMVFAEANAHGLPCITSHVGGIATAVNNHINGMTFALNADVNHYVEYIADLLQQPKRYKELAHAAHYRYETKLNWNVAVNEVKKLIKDVL